MIWLLVIVVVACVVTALPDTRWWQRIVTWLWWDPLQGCTCLRCRAEREHREMVAKLNEDDPLTRAGGDLP